MKLLQRIVLLGWIAAGLIGSLPAAPPAETVDFKEVYELLRANLSGMDEAALDRAAVQGLLNQLQRRVTLVDDSAGNGAATQSDGIIKSVVLDGAFGYVRIGQVTARLDKEFFAAYQKLASSGKLKGLVVDLRFANGTDYAAAAAAADWFFSTEQPLIDWGAGLKKSTARSDALRLPVAVLVNSKTAGAPEALAGILRQTDVALLIGSTTAGQASMFKEFPLKTGQRLRIATTPVKLGDGQPLPLTGLKPDIEVSVNAEDELAWIEDAYRVLSRTNRLAAASTSVTNETTLTGTNRSARGPRNEAELVRMHRSGQTPESERTNTTRGASGLEEPALQDPALVRALDLLKGLAVVQPFRSI